VLRSRSVAAPNGSIFHNSSYATFANTGFQPLTGILRRGIARYAAETLDLVGCGAAQRGAAVRSGREPRCRRGPGPDRDPPPLFRHHPRFSFYPLAWAQNILGFRGCVPQNNVGVRRDVGVARAPDRGFSVQGKTGCFYCGGSSPWFLCVCGEAKEAQEGKRPKPRVVVREVDGRRQTFIIVEPEVADRAHVYKRYRVAAGMPSAGLRSVARTILKDAGVPVEGASPATDTVELSPVERRKQRKAAAARARRRK